MSLELVNAIASVATAVVIGATAIAAMIQLRHLRMNNQITALLAVQAEFDAKDFRDAEALMRRKFPALSDDTEFCEYFIALIKDQTPVENSQYEEARHATRLVARMYENLGVLVKRGIIDASLILDVYSFTVTSAWSDLEGLVALMRAGTGEEKLLENFEYLASISQDHLAAHPDEYPRRVKRLNPRLPTPAVKLLKQK